MIRHMARAGLLGCVLWLAACTGGGLLAPGADYEAARSDEYRIVLRGETLYAIAWDVGVDYKLLAQWNGIHPPYTIVPGQRLRIKPPRVAVQAGSYPETGPEAPTGSHKAISKPRYYRVRKGDTVYSIARRAGLDVHTLARRNGIKRPYRIYPGQRLRIDGPDVARPTQRNTRSTPSANRRPPVAVRHTTQGGATHPPAARSISWRWPANGKIVKYFNPRASSKGIDIQSSLNTPVFAAAGGRVVYKGSGLRGYGQLIIIKHNADYLSAYAHNSRIFVKEGQRVKQGQKIAAMGRTGTNTVKLHFEIRRRGNPVNPLSYLPRQR